MKTVGITSNLCISCTLTELRRTDVSKLSKPQIEYGRFLIAEYASKHGIPGHKAIEILTDRKGFNNVWEWVNCDTFLNEELT